MRYQDAESPQERLRLAENTKLPEHRASIVVDLLPGQPVLSVKGIHAAQRKLHAPARRRKAAPLAAVRASDDHLHQDCIVRDVTMPYVNFEVGQCAHQLRVKCADTIAAFEVSIPGLVVVSRGIAEGPQDGFKVVLIFELDVLLNDGDAGRTPIFRNGCARQVDLRPMGSLRRSSVRGY